MKQFARVLGVLLAAGVTAAAFSGCSGSGSGGKKITMLNTKGEIQADFEELAKVYKEKTGVTVEITAAPTGSSPFATISSLYNSGNPPTLAMLDISDILALYEEKALDLSDEAWAKDESGQTYPIDGKIYSFPMGVEGKGLIYNKTLLDATLGRPFDPAEYNTYDKFKALLDELKAKGLASPVALTKEDWSLGSHVLGTLYESQADTAEEREAFLDQLRAGSVDVSSSTRFTQLMDIFDLLKENNINKADPMAADYAVDPSYIVDGKVAFWYNGNWAWPNIAAFVEDGDTTEYGMMPLPMGNDAGDFANTNLIGSGSKQIMIDRVKATEEEQQMAKDFLNWLYADEEGQKQVVDTLNMVPAFDNNPNEPADPLSQVVKRYVSEGKVAFSPVMPSDHWDVLGAKMQEYLAGRTDRAGLASAIEDYWKSQK
mgnify:CR=1 FL=1